MGSAGSKTRKSVYYRFRSWLTSMFATKGEQPSSITKVVGNLRNSLRRKNNGTPKKDKKAKSEEISEETPTKEEAQENAEKDSNIEENQEEIAKNDEITGENAASGT